MLWVYERKYIYKGRPAMVTDLGIVHFNALQCPLSVPCIEDINT